ncbi:MAG TPA: SCO family protein [Longimicrobium sp.]|nr:SCO family protein [Longimicrobium sp.]
MKAREALVRMMLGVGVTLVGVGAYATWLAVARPPAFHGTAYEPAPAAEFRLADTQGRPVTLASFRGAPTLLFFGYTKCTDFCPLTLDRLSRAVRELGSKAEGARIVFVTVDPAHDTPEVLRQYVARFGASVTALTGDSAALAAAWKGYGVYAIPNAPASPAAAHGGHHGEHGPAAPGALTHSGVVYGIDRAGNLRVIITESAPLESMRDDIRTLARL